MFGRLGIAGRFLTIAMLVLFAALVLGACVGFMGRAGKTGAGPRLPLPDQVAAIVELLEKETPNNRQLILRAVNSDFVTVALSQRLPDATDGARRMPGVEWFVDQYFATPGQRQIYAWDEFLNKPLWEAIFSGHPLRSLSNKVLIVVALKGGDYASFETHGEFVRVFGLPAGFWIGVLGAAIGLLAVRAIVSEARPLQALAQSVQSFAANAKPIRVEANGATETKALIAAVNDMQSRIEQLLIGRTLLLAAISHDMKTYLTRLRLRIETIPAVDQQEKAVRDLEGMTSLIDDALAVVRSNPIPGSKQPAPLRDIVLAEIADRDGDAISVRVMEDRDSSVIECNPGALRRLTANLVDNALRYGTSCEITLSVDPHSVILTVDDDGPGIAPQERGLVFEPFYRVEASRNRETGGTGLGLTIVKQVADSHGATVTVTQSSLGGARFTVVFPRLLPSPEFTKRNVDTSPVKHGRKVAARS